MRYSSGDIKSIGQNGRERRATAGSRPSAVTRNVTGSRLGGSSRTGMSAPPLNCDLEAVYIFVTAVRAGTFSAAARTLGVTPSAISKKVSRLESQLGVVLLNRTTRRFALTQIGRDFYDSCEKSVTGIVDAAADVARARGKAEGLLRVSVPQGFGRLRVAPLIPQLLARYPGLRIDLVFGRGFSDFLDATIDIVIGSADPRNLDLVVRKLMPFTRVTCAAPDYLARMGTPETRADLAGHNCLMFTDSDSLHDIWEYHHHGRTERVKVQGNFMTNNLEAMNFAVLGGLGIAHMPTFIVGPSLRSGALVEIFADDEGAGGAASMNAYYAPAKDRLPKVTAFIDCLLDHFDGPAD